MFEKDNATGCYSAGNAPAETIITTILRVLYTIFIAGGCFLFFYYIKLPLLAILFVVLPTIWGCLNSLFVPGDKKLKFNALGVNIWFSAYLICFFVTLFKPSLAWQYLPWGFIPIRWALEITFVLTIMMGIFSIVSTIVNENKNESIKISNNTILFLFNFGGILTFCLLFFALFNRYIFPFLTILWNLIKSLPWDEF
ncbi:hypothetical protein CO134_01640 [Candidatus Kuenenbacteria bacterium CG_4_9_14_3_um_filter_39_14]|uniref:Uncharacterized protein n=3 Tax=Candidatus Kueneniibacteriota TaxID=1752740 RepID=A0A2H0U6F3_9BACT|nr:MAG: hypothetical protein AUK13_02615 [Candidatus Kuenenbacteria bacterium CG2_30_39_24]PIR81060.1 MAG: hypothetical protein COU24_00655 [Candidatus Kuenenbacteria bacterium CG10_big_fil_rev_8_21_14_0_10_39_14]PJA92147.1 MAG: hypothetical protein CO134_01640 [Candidatus Kuenenbacteria bacterium CG_4_9_14_3_um_filter_39_14]